jgi:hypothetical protein
MVMTMTGQNLLDVSYNTVPSWEPEWTYVNLGPIYLPEPNKELKNVKPFEYGWRRHVGYKAWLRNLTSSDRVMINNIPVMDYVWEGWDR